MTPFLVPLHAVDTFWPLVVDDISKCLENVDADCCAGDLYVMCRQGTAFLMLIFDGEDIKAALVWRTETWPSGTILKNLVTVGKDMRKWLPAANEAARELARRCGARRYVWHGRKEWARIFRSAKVLNTTFIMEV